MKDKAKVKSKNGFFSKMDSGILFPSDMKKLRYKLLYGALVLLMLIFLAVALVPALWILLAGFKDVGELYSKNTQFFPQYIRLGKLVEAWNALKFYKLYINTFILAGGAVVVEIISAGLAGYVLSRLRPKGSGIVYTIVTIIMVWPATMSTVPIYMLIKNMGLLNSYLPIWMMHLGNAFNIMLFKNSFDGISKSLVDAAKIDGATDIGIFLKIIVPLSVPVIMTVAIFTFNGECGNFFWPYLLVQNDSLRTMGIHLYKIKSSTLQLDYQMLSIVFAILPQFVVFVFFNKYIMGGINIGGVKG